MPTQRLPLPAAAKRQIGSRLTYFRERAQLTQVELAEQASMNRGYLRMLESGKSEPGLGVLLRLMECLGVDSIEELLGSALTSSKTMSQQLFDSRPQS
jgi:transcriptional regulator with XRE-family HTH domain